MKRRKRKRKPIPNAGIVERAMSDAKWMRALTEAHEATARALERGRTVGRLEGVVDAAARCAEGTWLAVGYDSWQFILPVLRAECERLRSGKP